jgi:hypothetical protein
MALMPDICDVLDNCDGLEEYDVRDSLVFITSMMAWMVDNYCMIDHEICQGLCDISFHNVP